MISAPVPHRASWTPEEDRVIAEHFPTKGSRYVALALGRSRTAVQDRAGKLGVRDAWTRPWRPFEVAYLRKRWRHQPARTIARALHRSVEGVRVQANRFKLTRPNSRLWNADEVEYLRLHYKRDTVKAIGVHLGRTQASIEIKSRKLRLGRSVRTLSKREVNAIVRRLPTESYAALGRRFGIDAKRIEVVAREHGFAKRRPTSRPWMAEDDARLRALYGTMRRVDVAERLNRTWAAVAVRAHALGITNQSGWKIRRANAARRAQAAHGADGSTEDTSA